LESSEQILEVIFKHAGAGDGGEVGGKLFVDPVLEVKIALPDLAGEFHLGVEAGDLGGFAVAFDAKVGVGGHVGNAAVVGADKDFEVGDVFHPAGAAGFEADDGIVDGDVGANTEGATQFFVVVWQVVDAGFEDRIGVDELQKFHEFAKHDGVAQMDAAGEDVVGVVSLEDAREAGGVAEG